MYKIVALILTINTLAVHGQTTSYRTVKVDGLNIFYREAGPKDARPILFLHGFPSSSRMFESLFPLLSAHYHLIAPDYPGFGYSDAPDPNLFHYTFDHLASIIRSFTDTIGLTQYTLYMQDYGGPVGFRLALANPERVKDIIIQNAVAHIEGLSPLWNTRKAFWQNRSAHEDELKTNFTSLQATKQRHIGNTPHPEHINPDTWNDEYAFLTRPGETQIQLDLFYDYQTNVTSYPKWQQWLRNHQPRLLVLWGKYDPSFTTAGALAYKKDVPEAQVILLDAGHFALDEATNPIATHILNFLNKKHE
ncbi:MAG: alpha/beta hydrolase [Bacteroidetes bacterium]|nr:alpha/beta hydrolase [Bacteroidota bacterium]